MLMETARDQARTSLLAPVPPPVTRSLDASITRVELRLRGADAAALRSAVDAIDELPALENLVAWPDGLGREELSAVAVWMRDRARSGVRARADFLLDGDADAHAALARKPTSLNDVLESSRALRLHGVQVRWWVPVSQALAYRLESLFSLAHDERVEAVLVDGRDIPSKGQPKSDPLDRDSAQFVRDFIKYRLLEEEAARLSPGRRDSYGRLLRLIGGDTKAANATCSMATVLEFDQQTAGWELTQEPRVSESDGPHAPDTSTRADVPTSELVEVLSEGLKALLEWSKTNAVGAGRAGRHAANVSMPRVLVIGAYGGEHIGDAAILGGVLLRVHRRHGTREAILVSQRPEHTAHLVPMLDTPVAIRVEDYQQSTVGELLKEVDGVVFAGGPLMDLPKQLVKHLYAVSLARRAKKPFVLEGIGTGPFVRWPSFWTARRLVRMSDRIAVRTSDDGRAPLVRGLSADVGRDPAFDYLETRQGELTRLPEADRLWVDRLLKDTDGRVTVGINLRPIRPDYTSDTPADKRVEYTRFIETRFEERLTEAMRRFHKASTRPPCFVFFPMNAIQFGLSDLRSAYRMRRLLRGDVDFRVWEGDATIDGVIALLRRLDIAITMRFHATIYALVQQLNVIGVDYRVGRRDKVAALLGDFGRADDCARIDEMTTEWLHQRLSRLSQ
jgi:polysaccharide pyruvyl transferase WcaK-like protein